MIHLIKKNTILCLRPDLCIQLQAPAGLKLGEKDSNADRSLTSQCCQDQIIVQVNLAAAEKAKRLTAAEVVVEIALIEIQIRMSVHSAFVYLYFFLIWSLSL